MIPRAALVCMGFVTTGLYLGGERVAAGEFRVAQDYNFRAVEPCDPFAEETETGVPADTCVKFGGRVRVDLGAHGPSQAGRAYGAAPAAVRDDEDAVGRLPRRLDTGVSPSHLRLQGPDASATIDPASAR